LLLLTGWLAASSAQAQDACSTDIDCAEDLVCMRVVFGVDCNDAGCVEVQEQGFCSDPSPTPLFCDENNECPSPLFCDVENPGGPLCAYVEPTCSTDDDECPTGFMCVDLEPLGGCSICDDSEDIACTPAPCAENNLNVCSPIATACEGDSDCPEGFLCGEIGPFDLQTGWDDALVGSKGCLSIGLVAVTDGVVQGGQDVLPDGGVPNAQAGAGGSSGASAGNGGASGASAGSGGGGTAGSSGSGGAAGMDMKPASGGGDSGCSVGELGSSRALSVVMLLALVCGALLLRRWPVG
jgi:hypothetical protein